MPDERSGARPRRRMRRASRRFRAIAIALFCVAVVLLPVTLALDAGVASYFAEAPGWVLAVGGFFGRFGDWPWLMGYALVLLPFALRRPRRSMRRILVCMMLASSLAGLTGIGLKAVTTRTRPNTVAEIPQGFHWMRYEGEWVVGRYQFGSFPSGHASAACGFFGVLLFCGRRLALLSAAVIWMIPVSRMMTRSHHLSDVLAGSLLGLFFAALCWHVSYRHFRTLLRRLGR